MYANLALILWGIISAVCLGSSTGGQSLGPCSCCSGCGAFLLKTRVHSARWSCLLRKDASVWWSGARCCACTSPIWWKCTRQFGTCVCTYRFSRYWVSTCVCMFIVFVFFSSHYFLSALLLVLLPNLKKIPKRKSVVAWWVCCKNCWVYWKQAAATILPPSETYYGKMLGQNHLLRQAKTTCFVLAFFLSIFQNLAGPHAEHRWSCL